MTVGHYVCPESKTGIAPTLYPAQNHSECRVDSSFGYFNAMFNGACSIIKIAKVITLVVMNQHVAIDEFNKL